MRSAILLMGMAALALATRVEATTLNKCIDAQGKVTYSNLPCQNAREARTVDIDPVPQPDPVRLAPATQSAKPSAGSGESATRQSDTKRTVKNLNATGNPAKPATARKCDTLTEKLGRVFDKMDQARRDGYTLKQMNEWNQEVKDLERKKQQSGCF